MVITEVMKIVEVDGERRDRYKEEDIGKMDADWPTCLNK
jgi:hypothetical protein